MKGIIESVSQLHKQLEKHPDVKAVFGNHQKEKLIFITLFPATRLNCHLQKLWMHLHIT